MHFSSTVGLMLNHGRHHKLDGRWMKPDDAEQQVEHRSKGVSKGVSQGVSQGVSKGISTPTQPETHETAGRVVHHSLADGALQVFSRSLLAVLYGSFYTDLFYTDLFYTDRFLGGGRFAACERIFLYGSISGWGVCCRL